jgi:hypothetical protein
VKLYIFLMLFLVPFIDVLRRHLLGRRRHPLTETPISEGCLTGEVSAGAQLDI